MPHATISVASLKAYNDILLLGAQPEVYLGLKRRFYQDVRKTKGTGILTSSQPVPVVLPE